MTVLSVNVNKVAVLRNSRGDHLPSPLQAARVAIAAGVGGITVHPRPDMRHIRPSDVEELHGLPVELNIEGNPWAGPTDQGYPGFLAIVERARPAQCTLVPDGDDQITSDHGFDLVDDADALRPVIARLKALGCRISAFMDADHPTIERAADLGIDRIEIYTGPFAKAFESGDHARELDACARSAERARAVGVGVNAGHDLSQANLGVFLRGVPGVAEVSIGHALFGEALYDGLDATVKAYLRVIAGAR